MKILLAKNLGNLVPVDDEARDALKRFKQGEILTAEITKPRNIKHHRKFFAMLNIILDTQEYYQNITHLKAVCLCSIGHCETVKTKDGLMVMPLPMNFASMDQLEFEALYKDAVQWVCTTVVPGLDAAGLDEAVQMELLSF